jgi:transketolase
VEQLAALRVIPNLRVFRPADAQEHVELWKAAFAHTGGPTVLALTRQNLVVFEKEDSSWREHIKQGAYMVKDTAGKPELVLIATGSEVEPALKVAAELKNMNVRVVSMPCRELFLNQGREYREALLPAPAMKIVIEAGVPCGWHEITGGNGMVIGINSFGESGPGEKVAEYLGLHVSGIVERIRKFINNSR